MDVADFVLNLIWALSRYRTPSQHLSFAKMPRTACFPITNRVVSLCDMKIKENTH